MTVAEDKVITPRHQIGQSQDQTHADSRMNEPDIGQEPSY